MQTLPTTATSWQSLLIEDLNQLNPGLNIQDNPTNQAALGAWAQSEGVIQHNTPLAISGLHPGATTCLAQCGTGSPIYAYDTMANGVMATAQFLTVNNYSGVLKALASTSNFGNSTQPDVTGLATIWKAINESGWCRGCQGGRYPETLFSLWNNPNTQGAVNASLDFGSGTVNNVTSAVGTAVKSTASAVSSSASVLSTIGNILGKITTANFWLRFGLGLLGFILCILGIVFILSETKTGSNIASAAPVVAAL